MQIYQGTVIGLLKILHCLVIVVTTCSVIQNPKGMVQLKQYYDYTYQRDSDGGM